MNLYRKRYNMPESLGGMRKPDVDIRQAVKDSEALKKLESMVESGLHPTLIFFEKNMPEDRI